MSKLFDGSEYDFCTADDVYVDLAKALGTTGTITLDYYTLSVYGVGGDSVTWYALSTAKEYVAPDYVPGDADGDGVVSTADATAIFRYLMSGTSLDSTALAAADYDQDGKVSSSDVRRILKMLVSI